MLPKALNGFVSSGCLCDQLHVAFISDDSRNAFPHERVVINAEDSNPGGTSHFCTHFLLRWLGVPSRSRLSQRNHCDIGSDEPFSNAIEPGTVRSNSVPAPTRLRSLRWAPILLERSRIPTSPQCPSRPEYSTLGSIPQPLSRTNTLSCRLAYSTSISIRLACACLNAFNRASRPMR